MGVLASALGWAATAHAGGWSSEAVGANYELPGGDHQWVVETREEPPATILFQARDRQHGISLAIGAIPNNRDETVDDLLAFAGTEASPSLEYEARRTMHQHLPALDLRQRMVGEGEVRRWTLRQIPTRERIYAVFVTMPEGPGERDEALALVGRLQLVGWHAPPPPRPTRWERALSFLEERASLVVALAVVMAVLRWSLRRQRAQGG